MSVLERLDGEAPSCKTLQSMLMKNITSNVSKSESYLVLSKNNCIHMSLKVHFVNLLGQSQSVKESEADPNEKMTSTANKLHEVYWS